MTLLIRLVRWLCVFPLATVAWGVGYFLYRFLLFGLRPLAQSSAPLLVIYNQCWVLGDWISAFLFVWTGASIAPRFKLRVAMALTVIELSAYVPLMMAKPFYVFLDIYSWEMLGISYAGSLVAGAVACWLMRDRSAPDRTGRSAAAPLQE